MRDWNVEDDCRCGKKGLIAEFIDACEREQGRGALPEVESSPLTGPLMGILWQLQRVPRYRPISFVLVGGQMPDKLGY